MRWWRADGSSLVLKAQFPRLARNGNPKE